MDTDKGIYVLQLKAIAACGQSNGYLKKWASDKLTEIEIKPEPPSKREKSPAIIK